jgi:hypothetical protein
VCEVVTTIDAIEMKTFIISRGGLTFERLTIFHLIGFQKGKDTKSVRFGYIFSVVALLLLNKDRTFSSKRKAAFNYWLSRQ